MSKDIINKKVWLSKDTTAFIHVRLRNNSSWGTLKIADCNRIVDLDIEYTDKGEHTRTLKKLNAIIDNVTLLRDAMVKEGFRNDY